MTEWQVLGYNGAGGKMYQSDGLSGTIPDLQNGFGVVFFDFTAMQNGPSDGLALVDPEGRVRDLISYEGVFTATEGPAFDMVPNPIATEESGVTPVGQSIQLNGHGKEAGNFTWTGPRQASPGSVNEGQDFAP